MSHLLNEEHLVVLRKSIIHPSEWRHAKTPAAWAKSINVSDMPSEVFSFQKPIGREALKGFCTDVRNDSLIFYLLIMAWGSQRYSNARIALLSRSKILSIIDRLRKSPSSREDAFSMFTHPNIPALGPAYFTKLMYFFSQKHDHYILDQWTARSVNLLGGNQIIPLDSNHVSRRTTGKHYEKYCCFIEELSQELGTTPDELERLLFSEGGRNPAPWRQYVLQMAGQRAVR